MYSHQKFKLIALALAATALPCLAQAAQPNPDRYIVKFAPGKSAEARAALTRATGRVALELPVHDAVAVVLPAAALAGLSRNPNIEYIEPDVVRYPMALTMPSTNPPFATGQLVPYGISMVQADQVSDSLANNRKVCIIDSGYARGHEDLSSDASNITGEYDSGTGWWYTDENHHGTHVAGTVAAMNNAGVGVVGVAPNSKLKLHIVKVFNAAGWAYSSTLTAAVDKCASTLVNANVISMSLGGSLSSRTETAAFDKYYNRVGNSVLSIAAAGNGGNSRVSYPAGYKNVVSVAALDENKAWASFSQFNKDVEVAAPGVNVLSTVPMGTGRKSSLTVGSTVYAPGGMDGSPLTNASAPLADFGFGGSVVAGSMTGKVCLIQRGTYDFATKVSNCEASGGQGAVIYNNAAGSFGGTLGTTETNIPSVTASDIEGAAMKKDQLGQTAAVSVTTSNYAFFDGTSMATPHVSAVAALVWSYRPTCSAAAVRNALTASAQDLAPAGRDNKTGFGLVQALDAKNRLTNTALTSCP